MKSLGKNVSGAFVDAPVADLFSGLCLTFGSQLRALVDDIPIAIDNRRYRIRSAACYCRGGLSSLVCILAFFTVIPTLLCKFGATQRFARAHE